MVDMVLPAFDKGCVTGLMPSLCGFGAAGLPVSFGDTSRVLLVLDGLGWDQLQERRDVAPTLAAMVGGPITTVAPSTTAVALTSITTGLTPAEHGVVGYRMVVDDQVLNTLRWQTRESGDVRKTIPPASVQPYEPFLGHNLPYVTKGEFNTSGFTMAHLRGGQLHGYRTTAVLVHNIVSLLHEGEEAVYGYYDGIDKVSHEYGFGATYDAELRFVDRLVADLIETAPSNTQIIVTADHGHVDCRNGLVPIHPAVLAEVALLSGEARFRWLHAKPGAEEALFAAAKEWHSHHAWVFRRQDMIDQNWFGAAMSPDVAGRFGDVALLPFEPIGFEDPADNGPFDLVGRHGSLTAAEMLVPCIEAVT